MKKLHLSFDTQQQTKHYSIFIGSYLIEKIGELLEFPKYSSAFVLTDTTIAPLFLDKLLTTIPVKKSSCTITSGEQAKNIESVQAIWHAMQKARCNRRSLMLNLGGGVIGDIGAFAASTYMRGIDFVNIPTTLLAQVDASVGGKTGIDFAGIKNLIGTFDQPKAVIVDTQTLKTLPKREFASGFAEIIKHGLTQDIEYFRMVTAKSPHKFSEKELVEIIAGSCRIKAAIVQADQKENGPRKLLNFGHTVGHALEALSLKDSVSLLHGEAIALGMVTEAKISELIGKLDQSDVQTVENALVQTGLPIRSKIPDHTDVIDKMHSDKKNQSTTINFTLLEALGKGIINQSVPEDVLIKALEFVTK